MSESKIKIGVIGAGRMGGHHARILSRLPGVELVGVCDANLWRAQMAAWRHNCAAYRSYEDLLNQVDACVIAVPTELHFDIGMKAIELGVHCLVEKPLAYTVEQAKQLLAASEAKGVVLQVGHIERFNPAVLAAISHIKAPRFITVERLGPYDPRVASIGVVLDLMIHDLDIVLTLVGNNVASLEAVGASLLSAREDIANVRLRFESGCIADMTASRISLEKSRKIRIYQEDSYISLDYMNAKLKIYKKKSPVIRSLKDVEVIHPKLDKVEPLHNEHAHFLDCIANNRKPWPSGEAGLQAMHLAFKVVDELKRYELSGKKAVGPAAVMPALLDLGKLAGD
jgi:predicted dehydrogenase